VCLAEQHGVQDELEGGGEQELRRRLCEHEVGGLQYVAGAPAVEEEGAGLGLRGAGGGGGGGGPRKPPPRMG
jgi:hypothetical protein